MGDPGPNGLQVRIQNAWKRGQLDGVQDQVNNATDNALSTLDRAASWVMQSGQSILDKFFLPEKREAFLARLKAFMLANPKLSAFLGMNLALTGIPLSLFVLYSLSVFISSLIVGIIVGLLGAVSFTVLAVGAALLVVFPTVLFTTSAACFLFLWGLGGYYILRWANGKVQGGPKQAPPGQAIGDSLNGITGEKLNGFMQDAQKQTSEQVQAQQQSTKQIQHQAEEKKRPQSHPRDSTKKMQNATDRVDFPVTKDVTGATKPIYDATGTLDTTNGVISGATGLAV